MKAADFFQIEEGTKYLEIFKGATFVVKYGGAALEETGMMNYFLEDVAEMKKRGINIILVHGGGKMLSEEMKKKNLPVVFENGMRKTSAEAAELAQEVFAQLNKKICQTLAQTGCEALPLSRGKAIRAKLLDSRDTENRIGEVVSIDAGLIDTHYIPVISSIGQSVDKNIPEGSFLNINADLLAVSVAESVRAKKLIFISDVNGIYLDHTNPDTRLSHVTETRIMELINEGVLHGGMKLKVEMALKALKCGVDKIHFIDGRIQHSLMYEIFTEKGIGTEIVHNEL
ncbi:MAG: acetylglutamate kinase [Spirochaetia bacterium]|nr:acetylglutamate kinase [Spirochaetia bacterium]